MTTNTHTQAVSTGLGRVARVNGYDAHAGVLCLVLDELLKLVEGPRVEGPSLPLTEPTSIPNTLEAFKDDGHPVLFGVGDELLADGVVDQFLMASLPTGEPFEHPATSFARLLTTGVCLRLQRRPDAGAVEAVVGEVLPLKLMSCGIGGNVADTQVNAERIFYLVILGRFGCFVFYLNVKVIAILAPLLERGTGRILTLKSLTLKVTQGQREDATTINQAQADGLALHIELEDAGVVVNAGGPELTMSRLGLSQTGSYASDSTDCEVGRQAKLLAYVAVASLVQVVLSVLIMLVAPISHKVAGLGKSLKRRVNTGRHLRRHNQLTRKGVNRFHAHKYNDYNFITQGHSFNRLKADKPPVSREVFMKLWGCTKEEVLEIRPDLPPEHVDNLITYHHPGVLEQRLQQEDSDA